jgi:multiple sugar transport system permease protein
MSRYLALDKSNPLIAYVLLAPHAIFYVVFTLYSLVLGIVMSFQRWNPLAEKQTWVGTENYARLFNPNDVQARDFWSAMGHTFVFGVITVPATVLLGLWLAVLLYRSMRGRGFFRSVFYIPSVLSVTVISIVFRWLFADGFGVVPSVAKQLGLNLPSFLTSPGLAWVPVVLASVWWTVGQNMLLYLGGLGAISPSLQEAARIDGASEWRLFRSVTLPLLAPTTLLVTVTSVVNQFQMFGQSQIITGGGPQNSTRTVVMYITEVAFQNNQYSMAAAMSLILGVIMLAASGLQFRIMANDARPPRAENHSARGRRGRR